MYGECERLNCEPLRLPAVTFVVSANSVGLRLRGLVGLAWIASWSQFHESISFFLVGLLTDYSPR